MSEFQEGQKVRIKQTAWGDSTETMDVDNRGRVAELLEDMGTENGDSMWRAFVDDTCDEVFLLGSELEEVNA